LTVVQQAQKYSSVTKPQIVTITPAKKASVKWINTRGIDIAQKAVDIALSHVGTINYIQSGQKDWKNLDCGAMIQFAYKEAGIDLGKIGTDRIKRGEIGTAVKNEGDYGLNNAKPGDIIMRTTGDFYNNTKYAHVGLYAGNYQIVEVVESGQLRVASLKNENRWGKNGKYIKLFRVN
jgi:cell wall-associated NlpC family hydrolase